MSLRFTRNNTTFYFNWKKNIARAYVKGRFNRGPRNIEVTPAFVKKIVNYVLDRNLKIDYSISKKLENNNIFFWLQGNRDIGVLNTNNFSIKKLNIDFAEDREAIYKALAPNLEF